MSKSFHRALFNLSFCRTAVAYREEDRSNLEKESHLRDSMV